MKSVLKTVFLSCLFINFLSSLSFAKPDSLAIKLKKHLIPEASFSVSGGLSMPKQSTWDPIGTFEPKFESSFSYKTQINFRFKVFEGLNIIFSPTFTKLGYEYNDFELAFPAGMVFPGYKHKYYYYGWETGIELFVMDYLSVVAALGKDYLIEKESTSDSNFNSLNNFGNTTQKKVEKLTLTGRYTLKKLSFGLIYNIPLSKHSIEYQIDGSIQDYTKISGIYLFMEYIIF
ncbi:hypothetical protein [Tenuifilum thalassicum]|uniref:PorT family protein n=1 Tax=Tenuifilum thalassicum TaxID=2590900 RepID=A0A7D4BJ36_9BACT|nr:hypothetical protein [Tenuifilum thalassicum]QKG79239.1 hypothetical protein FHG85_02825 [Tenuifilum thalassicum]